MEKLNFVKNGVLRLPPGFRFHPTDEELILQYLRRKVYSCPLPASIIPDIDVCKSDPWDLPAGDLEQGRYFFSMKEAKYPNGNRSNRATVSGYWKATGIDRQVVVRNQVVGMKKTLVFYRGKPPHGSKTDWIMHEYRLAASGPTNKMDDLNQKAVTPPQNDWVLCRIFLKKKSAAAKNSDDEYHNVNVQTADYDRTEDSTVTKDSNRDKPEPAVEPIFYDFMARGKTDTDLNLNPTSPYSGSSCVTELSICNVSDEHEESSCNTHNRRYIPYFRRKP